MAASSPWPFLPVAREYASHRVIFTVTSSKDFLFPSVLICLPTGQALSLSSARLMSLYPSFHSVLTSFPQSLETCKSPLNNTEIPGMVLSFASAPTAFSFLFLCNAFLGFFPPERMYACKLWEHKPPANASVLHVNNHQVDHSLEIIIPPSCRSIALLRRQRHCSCHFQACWWEV